jgi:hypothetical protein
MNIQVKDPIYRDPFQQSDRGGFGPTNGKGDAPRTIPDEEFRKTMEKIQKRNPDGTRDMTGFKEIRPGVFRKKY